tara:strand:+ start:105 stop:434 length:330 start_codon:yes stop_codon:yes gene_type:complete
MPKPRKEVDPEVLRGLGKLHCTLREIADITKVSVRTLQRRHMEPIEEGRSMANMTLRRKQWDLAMAGDRAMLIWLGKQMLGQTERQEVTGKDGAPLTFVEIADRVFPQD